MSARDRESHCNVNHLALVCALVLNSYDLLSLRWMISIILNGKMGMLIFLILTIGKIGVWFEFARDSSERVKRSSPRFVYRRRQPSTCRTCPELVPELVVDLHTTYRTC